MGLPVDILSREESYSVICEWFKAGIRKPKIIVTAYSEFFVNARRDKDFAKIMKKADLVTPDGKSVLAAVKYGERTQKLKNSKTQNSSGFFNIFRFLGEGLKVGGEILSDKVGESVTGVWLFDKITQNATRNNWRIFVLGGWEDVSGEVTRMLLKRFPNMKIAYDAGESLVGSDPATDRRVVEKINKFKPDFLFVQYRPVVQEKWIASHIGNLKVGVAMGIGGTLDEYSGKLSPAPSWMERRGLKWLWRLVIQPRRWKRMIDAVIVFPLLVFKQSLKQEV